MKAYRIKRKMNHYFKDFAKTFKGMKFRISINDFFNDYQPERGDEVSTWKYSFTIIRTTLDSNKNTIKKFYYYNGWCYEDDINNIPIGIFSHWLLNNYKIYSGDSTALYNMYVGCLNLEENE